MNSKRRSLVVGALSSLAAGRSVAVAPAGKHVIVGVLNSNAEPRPDGTSFKEVLPPAMRQRGYVEGRNITYEWRYADNKPERLDGMAAELIAKKVDVIVAGGTPPTLAASKATSRIPIISVGGRSPVNLGLAKSLAQPGGNVTGITLMEGTSAKGVELLRMLVPRAKRIGWLMNPDNPSSQQSPEQLQKEGLEYGVELIGIPYRGIADLDRELLGPRRGRVDALYLRPDSKLNAESDKIGAFSATHKIPAVGSVRKFVPAGGLASFGQSYAEQHSLVAEYIDRLANGANVAELPIVLPTKFELFLNRRTAAALGITIPQDLLLRADMVVD